MPGYANALARYFASLFGTGQSKPSNDGGSGVASGVSNVSLSKRRSSTANRSGSSFATASQGDAAYYAEDTSTASASHKLHKNKKLSRSHSQADRATPKSQPSPANQGLFERNQLLVAITCMAI